MAQYMDTPTVEAARQAGETFGYPLMLKAKRLAYDGKGNAPVKNEVSTVAQPADDHCLSSEAHAGHVELWSFSWLT